MTIQFIRNSVAKSGLSQKFSIDLRDTQIKEMGPNGKEIGHWQDAKYTIMATELCCLMLEVYYRYLPTFKTKEIMERMAEIEAEDAEEEGGEVEAVDIDIEIKT